MMGVVTECCVDSVPSLKASRTRQHIRGLSRRLGFPGDRVSRFDLGNVRIQNL